MAVRPGPGHAWHVINASPDIAQQVTRYLSDEIPSPGPHRVQPVASVLLTNADLDHCLGLYALREGGELRVIAPDGVRGSLIHGLHLDAVLNHYNGIRWAFAPMEWAPLDAVALEFRAVPLPGAEAPKYDIDAAPRRCHGVGYLIRDKSNPESRPVGIFPDVASIDSDLLATLDSCSTVLFDGTFWTNDEMPALGLGTRDAYAMGHLPMSGASGSAAALSQLSDTRVLYIHINNTNPSLRPESPERAELQSLGLDLAEDGFRISL